MGGANIIIHTARETRQFFFVNNPPPPHKKDRNIKFLEGTIWLFFPPFSFFYILFPNFPLFYFLFESLGGGAFDPLKSGGAAAPFAPSPEYDLFTNIFTKSYTSNPHTCLLCQSFESFALPI